MRQVISAPVIMSNEVKCRVIQGILFPSLGKIHLIVSFEHQKFYKVQNILKQRLLSNSGPDHVQTNSRCHPGPF